MLKTLSWQCETYKSFFSKIVSGLCSENCGHNGITCGLHLSFLFTCCHDFTIFIVSAL